MKKYKLDREQKELSDQEVLKYKDFGKLVYNYHIATRPIYKKPLYKDPKMFIALVLIVLLAIWVAEEVAKEKEAEQQAPQEQLDPSRPDH